MKSFEYVTNVHGEREMNQTYVAKCEKCDFKSPEGSLRETIAAEGKHKKKNHETVIVCMAGSAFLTARELRARLNISHSTCWRWVRADILPSPIRLGKRAVRWRLADIEKFEASREVVRESA